ncbi:MAG: hypothetical protein HY360_26210 [Verrucomicrobia bacterium]|nr:hypothetical protein [Verrucomicrobiota bacterium]
MTSVLTLKPGPHLFLDDFLIERSAGIERRVIPPQRFLDHPVVTSGEGHKNWQCWITVLRDPVTQRFRMWYDADVCHPAEPAHWADLAYLESLDGIHWPGPYRALPGVRPLSFGANAIDDGPDHPLPNERFKMIYYAGAPHKEGLRVAFSPDGLNWTKFNGGEPVFSFGEPSDSLHAYFDPIRRRYFLIAKNSRPYTWTNAEGRTITKAIRRYGICFSDDFKRWTSPRIIFAPDAKDPGITEWYGMSGFQTRGDLIIGCLQVLRDDLTVEGAPPEAIPCNKGNPGAGTGYTVLAWTRDGEHWQRDRHTDKFFDPSPTVGAWDHAVTWIDSAVPVGDELYLYYAGYRWGHKYQMRIDRQLGVLKMPRDRYVARVADSSGGTITTPVVNLGGDAMTLNVAAARGEVRVQISDASGQPIRGFRFADCSPIIIDSLAASVEWRQSLAALVGRPVRLELQIRQAHLFALGLS